MNIYLRLAAYLICSTTLSTAFAETPTAGELLPLVPSLTTEGDDAQSFQFKFKGLTHDDIPNELDIRWRTDGRYSFLLTDSSTQTPIACFSESGFAVYNPLERTVTFGPEVTPELHLFADSDSTIKMEISWSRPDAEEPDPVSFRADLQSFATGDAITVTSSQSEGPVKMSNPSPSGKSYALWEFAVAPELEFERFSVIWKDTDETMVQITEVRNGEQVATLSAPNSVAEGSALKAVSWEPDGLPSFVELLTDVFTAIGGHAALTNVKYRQLKSYDHITDWPSVIDQCHQDRPMVMDMFSVDMGLSE